MQQTTRAVSIFAVTASLGLAAIASGAAFEFAPTIIDPTILGGLAQAQAPVQQEPVAATKLAPAPAISAAPERHDLRAYASADSFELEFALGPSFDFDGTSLGILDVGVHWFVADGVSFGAFVEGLVIDADQSDSWGFGAGLVARWHFVREEKFSLFIEGGAGFAGFSDEVPSGGTDYDFTPRAGLGATFALDKGIRLLGKVGWFHISNGQTGPNNPGLDSVSVMLGLSFTIGH